MRGRAIQRKRLRAGLSQAQAATRMPGSVSAQNWSDIENERRRPTLEWLWNAALALGCDPHELDDRLCPRPVVADILQNEYTD